MASSTLRKGSDFLDEDMKECQPCSVDGSSIAAETFCVDCDAYLCRKCTAHHKALKGTKTHALVKPDEAKKVAPKAAQDKCCKKCSVHPAKTVKYFCKAHSHLGCSVCFTMEHKACNNVEHIQTAAADIKRHAGFKKFDEDLRSLDTGYKTGLADIKKDLDNIQADEQHLRKAFKEFRKDVNDGLDKLEKEIFKQAKTIKDDETKRLYTLSRDLAYSKADVGGLIQKLDQLLASGKHCDAYVLAKTDAKQLESLQEALVKGLDRKTYRRVDFNGNMDVTKTNTLGKLNTREEPVSSSTAGLPRRVPMDGPSMARLMKKGVRVTPKQIQAPRHVPMDGPSMARLMKKGVRVRRGRDWLSVYRDQDGGAGQLGTVLGATQFCKPGYFDVEWDNGGTQFDYRMGADGRYDLEIVQ